MIQPKDIIILQNTVGEAVAQYITNGFFHFNLLGTVIRQNDLIGTTTINSP